MRRAVLALTMLATVVFATEFRAEEFFGARQVHVWRVGKSTFRALPRDGARLLSWERLREDGSVRPVIHHPDVDQAENVAMARGGIPVLFPFAGPSETGGQKSAWKDERGVIRPMPMHGIARQGRFVVSEISADGFTALFQPDADAEAAYPFRYRFEVRYRFGDDWLKCELVLTNEGEIPLPWSAGLHPYFSVPWSLVSTRSEYRVDIPAVHSWRRAGAGLVAGPEPRFPQPLGDPKLRQLFWTGLKRPEVTFSPGPGTERIRVTVGVAPGNFSDMAILLWTENDASPFFCVEPFMGPTNAAETGVGLHLVPPGGKQVFTMEIRVE